MITAGAATLGAMALLHWGAHRAIRHGRRALAHLHGPALVRFLRAALA